jgi:hypothetical protein
MIQECGVDSFSHIAKKLDLSEELVKIIIQSLVEKSYLREIDDSVYQNEDHYSCKFCPFANGCNNSDRLPSVFYELSNKGKKILNHYKMSA